VGYVFHILFALATLALVDVGWAGREERLWVLPFLALLPYALGWQARRAFLTGHFRLGEALERALAAAPVLLQLTAITSLGWMTTLERWSGAHPALGNWQGLELLAALAPFLAYQVVAIDARARTLTFAPDSVASARAFQMRMFVSALLPCAAYLGGASVLSRWPDWQVRFEEVGLLAALLTAVTAGLFVYAMPFFLRFAWDTAPLERGWARTMLEEVQRRAGFRCRELLVWRTGQQMSNAAIVGFTERTRIVFFSDLLIAQLGPRELAAVFAHELGHARRAHALVFGAFAIGFFLCAGLAVQWSGIESSTAISALVLGAGLAWYLSFGFLSRRFELEADLESLRILGESAPLVRALQHVTGAHAHERSSWRHFSTRDRVEFLERAERDPVVGLKLRLRLARWRRVGFALFAIVASIQLVELARSWQHDWLVVDLRLGEFERAAERAGQRGVEPELAALARLAAEVPAEARDAGALEQRALETLVAGDEARAANYLELARLRGQMDLDPVIDAVEALPRPAAADVPPPWDAVLEARRRVPRGP